MGHYDDDKADGSKSVFNAGIAQTERIDALQRTLNAARYNPFTFNQEVGNYNFDIMINSVDGLLMECWSKLKKDEQKKGEKLKYLVRDAIKVFPPIEEKKNHYGETELIKNTKNWNDKIEKVMFEYEKLVKDFLDRTNLNAPSKDEDDEGW